MHEIGSLSDRCGSPRPLQRLHRHRRSDRVLGCPARPLQGFTIAGLLSCSGDRPALAVLLKALDLLTMAGFAEQQRMWGVPLPASVQELWDRGFPLVWTTLLRGRAPGFPSQSSSLTPARAGAFLRHQWRSACSPHGTGVALWMYVQRRGSMCQRLYRAAAQ
jgi:hypothetical protein